MKQLSLKKAKQKRVLLLENEVHYDDIANEKIADFLIDLYNTGFNAQEREEILLNGILQNKDGMHMECDLPEMKYGVN